MYIFHLVRGFSLLFFLIVSTNFAQAADSKFAVVSSQEVIRTSVAFKDIEAQMAKKFNELRMKFDEKAKELRKSESAIEKQASILSQEKLKKEIDALNEKKRITQDELDADKQKLEKVYIDAMGDLNKKITAEIINYAKANKYDAVFEQAVVIYRNGLSDITGAVIEIINREIPNYKINFAQSKEEKKDDKK